MEYFLGIDISTTATKALLLKDSGQVLSVASCEYAYETPFTLWAEQDPELWWRAAKSTIQHVLAESGVNGNAVKGIGLTGQMHGLVLLNADGKVLRPAILWNDQRTVLQCDDIRERFGKDQFIQLTGNDPVTSFTLPKILWVQDHEPEIWDKTRHILLPKDYVRYKLTGSYAMDKAGGSGTILFDIEKRDWSQVLLDQFNIPAAYLPDTFEGTQATGTLSNAIAQELGLASGIKIYAGGGDQQAGAVGTGAIREGIVSISLGTSGVIFAATDKPFIDIEGRLDTFCHSLEKTWSLMGVMLSAGGSLRWFRDTLFTNLGYDELLNGIEHVKPGSDGLIFLPYLTGERTPYADPFARGAFVGLTVRHDAKHMARAVLEGISFGMRDCFELMKVSGLRDISQVRITGGGAKNAIWRQMLADILRCEVAQVNTKEGAAFGAGLLAAVGNGAFSDVNEACTEVVHVVDAVRPGEDAESYQDTYPIYHSLYSTLKSTFHKVSGLSE